MKIWNKICTAASCLARRNCTCRSWRPQMRTWRAWAGAGRLLSSRMSCISVKSPERLAQSAIVSPGPKAIPEIAVKAEQLDEPLAKRWLKWVGPEKGGWDEKLVAHLSLKIHQMENRSESLPINAVGQHVVNLERAVQHVQHIDEMFLWNSVRRAVRSAYD